MRCGLILAGGDSRRMGVDKHKIEIIDKSMMRLVADALLDSGCNCLIIANGDGIPLEGWNELFVTDEVGWVGPQAGLVSGLKRSIVEGYSWVQISPCDMPLLGVDLVNLLWENRDPNYGAIVPEDENGLQPLLALVQPQEMIAALNEVHIQGVGSIFAVLKKMKIKTIGHDEIIASGVLDSSFLNANTPHDIDTARELLKL